MHGDTMSMPTTTVDTSRFEYAPPILQQGTDCVADLSEELARAGLNRALVVCGHTVGDTPAVINPVTAGLDDRLVGIVAETTPKKRLATAYHVRDRFRETDADVLVGLGGGSSIDVAKIASLLMRTDRSRGEIEQTLAETGTIPLPDGPLPPVIAIPTTLAGADISQAAGITIGPDSQSGIAEQGGSVADPELMPAAVFADPALIETTPRSVLAASAINGFDKGIETLYAANRTPITDATAVRGLEAFTEGLLALGNGIETTEIYRALVRGLVCVQYGISRPDGSTLSVIHAFGHALARTSPVQQGTAHAIIAPHALSLVFDRVNGRRELLAQALGVGETNTPGVAVVDRVTEIRETLGLPSRLRDVDGPDRSAFDAVVTAVLEDPLLANAPPGLELAREDVRQVLEQAW